MGPTLARPLLSIGVVAAVVGAATAHAATVAVVPYDLLGDARLAWTMVYLAVLLVAAYAAGLPELPRTVRGAAAAGLATAVTGAGGLSLVQLLLGAPLLPRFVIAFVSITVPGWSVVCWRLACAGQVRGEEADRVLVVAPDAAVELLAFEVGAQPERPFRVVGEITPEDAVPRRTAAAPLLEALSAHDATVLVLAREAQEDDRIVAQAAEAHERGVRVRTLARFYEEWLGKFPVGELERMVLLVDIGDIHRARYARVKRILDVAVALVGLVALAVVTPVVVLGNLLGNRGPLVFRQERVGQRGRPFTMLKFRTMRAGGDSAWTMHGDARVTPFGRVLRRSHLDELPQVLNVLRGSLSFVGPRPEQPAYVEELREKLPFYDLRHLVRPGLTGWAQVKFGYASSERDALEKLQYELYYLRRQSLVLDLRILGRTLRHLTRLGGR